MLKNDEDIIIDFVNIIMIIEKIQNCVNIIEFKVTVLCALSLS